MLTKILIKHTEVQIHIPNTVTNSLQYGQYHPNQTAENHSCDIGQSKTIDKKKTQIFQYNYPGLFLIGWNRNM